MRNFTPQTQQFSERPITRDRRSFGGGAFDDISPSKIPSNGVKWLENLRAYEDRLEVRGGTKRWFSYQLPAAGILYGFDYHVGHDIIVVQIASALYVIKGDGTADAAHGLSAGWNRIYHWYNAAAMTGISATPSQMAEYGDYMVVFNAGGIFCIDFASTTTTWWPINTSVPTRRLSAATTIKSAVNKHGCRYLYTMSRIRGAGATGNRTTSGAVVELESGPTQPASDSYLDYGEVWTPNKIGPSTAAENYDVWTGGTLPTGYDTITEVEALSNAQFKITGKPDKDTASATYNIASKFTGVTSWAEIAEIVQTACREYLPEMDVSFNSSNKFVFKNLVKGATITAFAAGDGGTDISSMFYRGDTSPPEGASVSTAWDIPLLIGADTAMLIAPLGTTYLFSHWTHFSLYRTLDIGEDGIDPISGQGNNKELYVWVADHRICNPFKCTTTGTGASRTLTAAAAVFTAADVGSLIYFRTGASPAYASGTITAYTSATVVTISVNNAVEPWLSGNLANVAGVMGDYYDKIDLMSQAGTTVTPAAMSFVAGMVGSAIHWQDGTVSVITAVNAGLATVADSATRASQGAGLAGYINESEVQRWFKDTISDDTLRTRISNFTLKNRFWEALPNCNTGIISNGFMVAAIRGARKAYYGQMPEEFDYLWGYYNAAKQVVTYKDLISQISYSNDNAIVHLYNSTWRIPLNNYIEVKIEEIGEVVVVLTGTASISPRIGCVDYGSVIPIDDFTTFFISSDNEALLLKFDGGFSISQDLALDRFSKRLKKNAAYSSVAYEKTAGLIIWIKTDTTDDVGTYTQKTLDKSYTIALLPEHGVGVSENTGSAWVLPPSRTKAIQVYDSAQQIRTVVIDSADGYLYEMGSREGPTGGAVGRRWKDKILTDGTGGTNIAPSVLYGLDEGTFKHFYQEFLKAHAHVEPFDRSNAGASGYDAEGYPDDIEFDLTVYADGSTTTVKGRAKDIVKAGQITLDRYFRAHGIQCKLSANKAEFILTDFQVYYKTDESEEPPEDLQTTEMTHKADLASVDTHFAPINGNILNLVTGKAPTTVPTAALVAGPCGQTRGITIGANTIEDTNKSLSYAGDFSILIGGLGNVDSTGTYFYIGAAFWIRVYNDVSASPADYKIAVRHNGTTYTHTLAWTGTGWVNILVVRSGTSLKIFEADNI